MRKTHATVQVAIALLKEPDERHWGYELSRTSGVRSGTLYPMLTSMLEEQWLSDGWEDRSEVVTKRPPRRYYELTHLGKVRLGALLAEAKVDRRFAGISWPLSWMTELRLGVALWLRAF